MRRSPLTPLVLSFALPAASSAGAPLTVTVTGIGSAAGQVRLTLCPEAEFLKPHCPYSDAVPARGGSVTFTIPNVAAGTYGAIAYWDKNGNGRADRNFLGIPTEMVGFSNDAPTRFAPPRFADAAFRHGDAAQQIAFHVRRLP